MKRKIKCGDEYDLTLNRAASWPAWLDRARARKKVKTRINRRERRQFDYRKEIDLE